MAERIFVTGATGRIGRRLVAHLVSAGHEVSGLARSDRAERTLRELGASAVRGDIYDIAALEAGVRGADRVYHLAGGIRGPGRETPERLNHQGTRNLLQACRGSEKALRSVLLASSTAVYGDRSNLWVEEDFTPLPNTRYGRSKLAAEAALHGALDDTGLRGVVARIGAVYGRGFPFAMAERIRAGRGWLPGEGRNYVPVIAVQDCVEALVAIAERAEPGSTTHVASPEQVTLRQFYEAVHRAVGGRPMRFWSTYVPSYVQLALARRNEQLQSHLGRKPRFTPDNLRLYTNSVRVKVQRLAQGLDFTWRHPDPREGVAASFTRG